MAERQMRMGRALYLVAALAAAACGGSQDSVSPAHGPNDVTAEQIDADPLALLPSSAALLVRVDAASFYKSSSLGSSVAALSDRLLPIGEEAGFLASRDVDQVTAAAYSMQGADVAAVIKGRFDRERIEKAVANHTPTRGGGVIVSSTYAGRNLYTVNNTGFTILTPHTALAGTESGMRRTLDRIKDGHVKRDLPEWMTKTIETDGAAIGIAADFSSQEMTQVTSVLPWLAGIKMARILANFHEPGLNVAGTLTYADAGQAQSASEGLRRAGGMANLIAVTGLFPQLQGLLVSVADANVEVKFALDDQSLRRTLSQVPQWIQGASR